MAANARSIFVADAHISGLDDENQLLLAAFFNGLSKDPPQRLFLLGDIFDFWLGSNGVLLKNYGPVINALKTLKAAGVDIICVEGNHDFFLKRFFEQELGFSVYPDFADIALDGKRIYLAHGDAVDMTFSCSLWRAFIRSAFIRVLERVFPGRLSWRIGRLLSSKSRARGAASGYAAIDERLRAFAAKRIEEGFDAAIFGHSHRAAADKIESNGKKGIYANPGGWTPGKTYLVCENGIFRVERFEE